MAQQKLFPRRNKPTGGKSDGRTESVIFVFEPAQPFVFMFDENFHPNEGVFFFELNQISVMHPDAAPAVSARHCLFIVGAAMYSNAIVRFGESEKPISVS